MIAGIPGRAQKDEVAKQLIDENGLLTLGMTTDGQSGDNAVGEVVRFDGRDIEPFHVTDTSRQQQAMYDDRGPAVGWGRSIRGDNHLVHRQPRGCGCKCSAPH